MPNADTKPTDNRANNLSKKQSIHKKKHGKRRVNRISPSKAKRRGGPKNGTKGRRAGLKKKKAGKKQRMGRNGINGNKSKRCKGKRTKKCRGRRGRQIKQGKGSRRRGRRNKLRGRPNRQNSRCKKKGGKKRGKFCHKRKGRRRGGRAGDPECFSCQNCIEQNVNLNDCCIVLIPVFQRTCFQVSMSFQDLKAL